MIYGFRLGVNLANGSETNIAIDRTLITQKPPPYTRCVDSKYVPDNTNFYIDRTFTIFGFYSKEACLQVCYQKFLNDLFTVTVNLLG